MGISILTCLNQILKAATPLLGSTLSTPTHSPQVSLLLAFYKMLGPTCAQIDGLSQKHLDFNLKKVLHQRPRGFTPDRVFLTFQGAPDTNSPFLPKGTPFLAGSSEEGSPIIYESERSISINQAKPIAFKAIHNGTTCTDLKSRFDKLITAAPIANSGDGLGGKLEETQPSWPTFGQSAFGVEASLGFAVSSSGLFYSDGQRRIKLRLFFENNEMEALSNSLKKLDWPELTSTPQDHSEKIKQWDESLHKITKLHDKLHPSENPLEPTEEKNIPAPEDNINQVPEPEIPTIKSSLDWSEKDNQTPGLDVSSLNGDVDWDALQRNGLRFAFVRATSGDKPDSNFSSNWTTLITQLNPLPGMVGGPSGNMSNTLH